MGNSLLKLRQLILIGIGVCLFGLSGAAQYKTYELSPKGDTMNATDKAGLKQGKWVIGVGEIRGEPGYDEEGLYKDDQKTGVWRKYSSSGDVLAMENYLFGGKDGRQEYFNFLGQLQRQEGWRGFNPNAPFDSIPVYGTENNEILSYKIVKALQYSVPDGEWNYFNASGGIIKTEKYDRGRLLKEEEDTDKAPETTKVETLSEEKVKTKEVLEYEKKYSKKKRQQLERDGKTGL